MLARTGYTGEDGFELFLPSEDATGVWDLLLAENRERGLEPCGLGARDVLRLEAGMPLYGHELTEEITPLQAGMAWAIKFDKPAFTGREALLAQRDGGDYARIVGLVMEGRVPARAGYPVFAAGGKRSARSAAARSARRSARTSRRRSSSRRPRPTGRSSRSRSAAPAIPPWWHRRRSTSVRSRGFRCGGTRRVRASREPPAQAARAAEVSAGASQH